MDKNSTLINLIESTLNDRNRMLEGREIMESAGLNSAAISPPSQLISNILNYSRAITVIKTKSIGTLDMVLN